MNTKSKEKTAKSRISLLVPVMIIFCLMVCMVLYTSRVIRSVTVSNIHEVGEDRISAAASQLENYLETTKSVLWVTADAVDHMAQSGASTQEILQYITEESTNQEKHFDENYTGIYGYVTGEYLDGVGWTPPADYDPTERDWYLSAIKANGEPTIVSPYVDAQTNAVIISISRMLSNGTDVLSMDVTMNHIQETVSNLQIKGKGYGFIVNQDGMVIAHQDETRKGQFMTENEEQQAFLTEILNVRDGNFEIEAEGQKCTAFVHPIMDQWYVVIVISNRELFAEVWQQLIINVLICTVIFALIAFSYLLGHKNEQLYSRRIEEMRIEEQRQAYEAKALKLEKEAADRANKAKSDFLADMSHEIRTPINAVLGMNEMILRESVPRGAASATVPQGVRESFDNIRVYAGNIASAGSNLLSIINDILDFSKIESGKLDLVYGSYQLSSVLNDVSNMIYFKAKEKDLEFVVDVDETLPDGLYGDEVRVRQILTNILNNAVKYTNEGSVRLLVRGQLAGAGEQEKRIDLTVSVVDTGIGIKQEDIGKLFAKFQRVDLNTNSTVEGTGLGLAITRSLLQMMDGNIMVESEYGVGSTFIIALPQKVVSEEPIGDFQMRFKKDMLMKKAYEESFRAPDAHILIVDDTRMNLTVAVGLLKNTGVRIETAGSGEEALLLTQKNSYDLILMDQRMPRMDGTEALKRIRTQVGGANRDTKVICLTADAVVGARERYLADGFTDYLTKPIDSRALEQALIKYLPEDKIQVAAGENNTITPETVVLENGEKVPGSWEDEYSCLRVVGIDPETGLKYCMNDADFYQKLLAEYVGSFEEKASHIRQYFEAQDWKNYGVLVHALKSTSKMIGATELSGMAAHLEELADEQKGAEITAGHAPVLKRYEETVHAIEQLLQGNDAGEALAEEEGDIFEFFPEEQ